MSKLTDFYKHKEALKEQGLPIDPQMDQLEDQLLKEELMPELIDQLRSVLSKVKTPLLFNGHYDPYGNITLSLTRKCLYLSSMVPSPEIEKNGQTTGVPTEEPTLPEPKFTKSKSIGFSVSFRDGTVYHEKRAVNTWILALKKIGLENICNNRSKHQAWHRVAGRDICIVERTETVRETDGKSPQTLVDGFYVMTQLSNDQKEKDLMALADYLPKLGIKVIWDDAESASEDD